MTYRRGRRRDLGPGARAFLGVTLCATVATGGTVAVVALLEAVDDSPEAIEYCASRTDPPLVADDRFCEDQATAGQYGTYVQQLPDDDGAVVIVNSGSPVPSGAVPAARGATARTVKAGAARAASGGSSTITRGGLGVAKAAGGGSVGS